MTQMLLLIAFVTVSLFSLQAWGEDSLQHSTPPDKTQRNPAVDCGPYADWDPEAEGCRRNNVPRFPSLAPSRPPLPPPEGVIVLYPDGTREEQDVCPPGFRQETRANNWRFCTHPQRRESIPPLWSPPINGIPYEEVEEIFERNRAVLTAIEGVSTAGLGANAIHVYTAKPELVPKEVEGVPIQTLPAVVGIPLSHTDDTPLRPLKASASIGSPTTPLPFEFFFGTLTGVALSAGEPWLVLPAHILRSCDNPPTPPEDVMPCPIGNGKKLNECTHYGGTRSVWQPFDGGGLNEVVGLVPRWDPIPFNSNTPTTLDVAAAFADDDTTAANGFLPVSREIEGFGEWSGMDREPNIATDTNLTIVSGLGSTPQNHLLHAKVTDINLNFPFDCSVPPAQCGQTCNGGVLYTTKKTMVLEMLPGSLCPVDGDSGSPVLGSDKKIIGMLVGTFLTLDGNNNIIDCGGLATSAVAIRNDLDFDTWLGTQTSPLTGNFDTIDSLFGLPLSTWGWAKDPVNPNDSIQVEIYVGGEKGIGALADTIDANESRIDVDPNVNHGFHWEIPSQYLTGTHDFYIYAKEHSSSTFTTHLPASPRSVLPNALCAGTVETSEEWVLVDEDVTGVRNIRAIQTISAGPDFTITSTGCATFSAGSTIWLDPGFKVEVGGRFAAAIEES